MLKLKYKFLAGLTLFALLFGFNMAIVPKTANAESIPAGCPGSTLQGPKAPSTVCPTASGEITDCTPEENVDKSKDCIVTYETVNECKGADAGKEAAEGCGIFEYINTAIRLLSVMIGIVVTIMIMVGGIQYTTAGGDPNKVMKAKGLIFKAIFTLVGYGLLYAIMFWLLPGGVI